LNLLTPIKYGSKLNNRDTLMVQIHWTQTSLINSSIILCYNKNEMEYRGTSEIH